MSKIDDARKVINEVDGEMAKLFEKRMRAVEDVFDYKKEHGLPIFDKERESEVIEKNSQRIEDAVIKQYYIDYLKSLMDISKKYQYRMQKGVRIAYSGIEGAFAQIAASKLYPKSELVPKKDFRAAYRAAEDGECDLALLPVENSTAGEVGAVLDMIFDGNLFINGIYGLEVNQNLLGIKGSRKSDIKYVLSHRQALEQCSEFIKENGFDETEEVNTAVAAKKVAEAGDKSKGAIASIETAQVYGLNVIERNINKSNVNTTRFAVLSKAEPQGENERSVLMFTVADSSGALAKAVNVIAKYGFNMTALRSRPLKNRPWGYYFYVETDKAANDKIGQLMLEELKEYCGVLKNVGTFTERTIGGDED